MKSSLLLIFLKKRKISKKNQAFVLVNFVDMLLLQGIQKDYVTLKRLAQMGTQVDARVPKQTLCSVVFAIFAYFEKIVLK